MAEKGAGTSLPRPLWVEGSGETNSQGLSSLTDWFQDSDSSDPRNVGRWQMP